MVDLKSNTRLAAIYKLNSDSSFNLIEIAFVDYDYKENSFVVSNGTQCGKNQDFFTQIHGDPHFIEENKEIIVLKNEKNTEYYIYLFKHDFINEYMHDYTKNRMDSIFDICIMISRTCIKNSNGKYYSEQGNKDVISTEKICEMLDYDTPNFYQNIEKQFRETLNIPYTTDYLRDIRLSSQRELIEKVKNKKKYMLTSELRNEISNIISDLKEIYIGQEDVIEIIVTNLFHNQFLIDSLDENDVDYEAKLENRKVSILIDGTTGTGKTAIVNSIAKRFKIPVKVVSASSFSESGYVGPSVTDILKSLLKLADGDIDLAQRAIVIFDETDKLARKPSDSDDMKFAVQDELLAFVGGAKYEVTPDVNGFSFVNSTVTFDTSKLTFVFCGAFTDLKEEKIREQTKNNIGFTNQSSNEEKYYEVTEDDYINYGLKREFFGRIRVIVNTKTYTVEDLKNILLYSKISPLKGFLENCKMYGYDNVELKDEFITQIAIRAHKMNLGARSLQSVFSYIQNELLLGLMEQAYSKDDKLEIDEKILIKCDEKRKRKY